MNAPPHATRFKNGKWECTAKLKFTKTTPALLKTVVSNPNASKPIALVIGAVLIKLKEKILKNKMQSMDSKNKMQSMDSVDLSMPSIYHIVSFLKKYP